MQELHRTPVLPHRAPPAVENAQIAEIFDEIADLLELRADDQFRIRAYRSAAQTVRSLPQRLQDLVKGDTDLAGLPHIGKATAEKIAEILETGSCRRLQELRKAVPAGLTALMKVPQLGAKRAKLIYDQLQIDSLEQLTEACEQHRIRQIRSMGERTEQNILRGLATISGSKGRMLLKPASEHVEALERYLRAVKPIQRWQVAGSYRRRCETLGDLDLLISARDREAATEAILKYPGIERSLSRGPERVTVQVHGGLQVDFRFFEPQAFGAASLYFTGSKAHNIALRRLGMQHRWKLNEYGLFRGNRRLAGATEEQVYAKLGLKWIAPELREDRGEIEAALHDKLPRLIDVAQIRGDLHCHTQVTDGANTIEEMATAARQRGYQYLAITDHSKAIAMANGLDEARLRKHAAQIRELEGSGPGSGPGPGPGSGQGKGPGLWLLAGIEVDILKDGQLDLSEKALSELDWVVASVHSHFDLGKSAMTTRLLRAIKSGVVDCIGHPTCRLIGKRDPIQADWDKVFDACKKHHVRLEINSQHDRLDLPDNFVKQAKLAGVGFVISTDAHKQSDLEFMYLGVGVARRG